MRLFIGLPLPAGPAYAEVTADLLGEAPGARPVPAGSWHITLRFLGEVFDAAPVVAALDAACLGRPALPCVVEGLGTFPGGFPAHKRARIAWAGVRAPGIDALAQAVVQATASFGEAPEDRPFVAHATLARLPRPTDLRRLAERHKATLFAEGLVDRVVLFRSTLGPGGAQHEALHTVRLGAQA